MNFAVYKCALEITVCAQLCLKLVAWFAYILVISLVMGYYYIPPKIK